MSNIRSERNTYVITFMTVEKLRYYKLCLTSAEFRDSLKGHKYCKRNHLIILVRQSLSVSYKHLLSKNKEVVFTSLNISSLGLFLFYRPVRTITGTHHSVNFYFTDLSEPSQVSDSDGKYSTFIYIITNSVKNATENRAFFSM